MPKLTNNIEVCEDLAVTPYKDRSIYFDNGEILAGLIDMRKLRTEVVKQMQRVGEATTTDKITTRELLEEIHKLRDVVRLLEQVEDITRETHL